MKPGGIITHGKSNLNNGAEDRSAIDGDNAHLLSPKLGEAGGTGGHRPAASLGLDNTKYELLEGDIEHHASSHPTVRYTIERSTEAP